MENGELTPSLLAHYFSDLGFSVAAGFSATELFVSD
jgi:hypothetical protein